MRALLTVLMVLVALLGAGRSSAQDPAALIAQLGEGNFNDKATAAQALASSGIPSADAVLSALLEGNLFTRRDTGVVVIGQTSGGQLSMIDPLTQTNLGAVASSDLRKITINNSLRGQLRGLLGGLNLVNPDPSKRLDAANAVFTSGDVAMLEPLKQAVAKETDAGVARAMKRALGIVTLMSDSAIDEKLAALETLSALRDPELKSYLLAVQAKLPMDGADANLQSLNSGISDLIAAIDTRLEIMNVVQTVFQGVSLASVLLLAAIGLAITFGQMGVINMAHGEMIMLGAYTTYVVQQVFHAVAPDWMDFSLLVALPLAFIVSGAVGVLIERSIIRFLYGRPLETLLATWGLSLILQQGVRTIFGPTNREVISPSWMSGAIDITSGLALTSNRIVIVFFSAAVLAGLMIAMHRTSLGLQVRAVTQNRRMAASMGIRTAWIDAMTFGLGSGIAGIAGVALSQIDNVSPNLGQSYIIDSFMVVVFGGVGNLWGTLVGALSLGVANKFLEPYAGAVLAKIFILVAIILFIQKRPRGLFALKGRSVES
jgi:urea transport system permease protein